MPSWAAMASAATITRKALARARRMPVKIDENVPGRMTRKKMSKRLAPRVLAPRILSGLTDDAPAAVETSTTKVTA